MPFELSEEQELVRRTAREFAEQTLEPVAERADREAQFPPDAAKDLAELGLLGLLVPAEHGGAGLDAVSLVVVTEELALSSGGVAVAWLAHNVAARALAGDPQTRNLAPRLAAGEAWASLCLAEGPLAAQFQGKDRLNGSARPFPRAGQAEGALLPHPAGGLAWVSEGATWIPEGAMGLRAAELGSLVLRDAPARAIRAEVRAHLQLGLAGLASGLGQASVRESAKFAKDRTQFGKPIASFDAVRARLADMAASIDAGRALALQAAAMLDRGKPAERLAAEAKLVATETASSATRAGVKLHGGAGFLKDFAVERLNRDARMLPLLGGDSAAQRDLAARQLLR